MDVEKFQEHCHGQTWQSGQVCQDGLQWPADIARTSVRVYGWISEVYWVNQLRLLEINWRNTHQLFLRIFGTATIHMWRSRSSLWLRSSTPSPWWTLTSPHLRRILPQPPAGPSQPPGGQPRQPTPLEAARPAAPAPPHPRLNLPFSQWRTWTWWSSWTSGSGWIATPSSTWRLCSTGRGMRWSWSSIRLLPIRFVEELESIQV